MKTLLLAFSILSLSFLSIADQAKLSSEEITMILERHNYWRADVGVMEELEW